MVSTRTASSSSSSRKRPHESTTAVEEAPMSVERKLELLESRFTQPSVGDRKTGVLSGTTSWNGFDTTSMTSPSPTPSSSGRMSPHSEHSFQFPRTPLSNQSSSNPLPASAVRSRRRPSLQSSFHSVSMAAARHIRKVVASSDSNQTVVTGNHHAQAQENRVVAESPPFLVSPPNRISPAEAKKTQKKQDKPKAVRNLVMMSSSHTASTTATNNNSPSSRNALAATTSAAAASTATTPITSTSNTSSNNKSKRKSAPKRKLSSIKDKSNHTTSSSSPALSSKPHSATTTATTIPTTAAKKAKTSELSPARTVFSELSRDRSRSNSAFGAGGGGSSKKTTTTTTAPPPPPANNRKIHDFFRVATSSTSNHHSKNHNQGTSTTTATTAATSVDTTTNNNSNSSTDWQSKCQTLEQLLQDKDQQLKAVTNNKTILHTALQSALDKTKHELTSLRESQLAHTNQTHKVLEELIRWKSSQQDKELRESLASNGARLGRIQVQKVGLRAVESWEEGYATKDLQHRKNIQKERYQNLQLQIQAVTSSNSRTGKDPLAQLEAKESLQRHLRNCQQALRELAQEEQALNDEKGAHIRALKRVASEDSSHFRSKPKLHDRYVLQCILGKGGFSEVWKGYDLVELREVAVKIHQLDPRWPDSKKENYTKHVSREYEIHRNVRHDRIVSLFDVFEINNDAFATVLECCNGTDLDTLLKTKKRLPEREARAILLQILCGMRYLSEPGNNRQGIIHYDLKPGNILFDEMGDAKITDFGLSKIIDAPDPGESMELTSQGAGTYWYLPPECFITTEKVRISNKVDVWSIGVIYYQMLYGMRPFGEGKSQDRLIRENTMLHANEVHFPERIPVSQAAKEFIQQCLQYDQAFRPNMAQLCKNPYVLQDSIDSVELSTS